MIATRVAPQIGKALSWEPTLIWDEGSSREGWIVYSHSPAFGHPLQGLTPTYLVGRRVRFELESELAPTLANPPRGP